MPYLEKTIVCGDYVHTRRYFAWKTGTRVPIKKEKESPEDLKARNERHAEFNMQCLIQTNFPNGEGSFVTLTHAEKIPIDEKEAKRRAGRYIRDLREDMKKRGKDLKYIVVHEQQGGRWHTHLIVNERSLDALVALWKHGRIIPSPLDASEQYADLAHYLLKGDKPPKGQTDGENNKTPRRKHARRWSGSRNLQKPSVTVKEIKRESLLKQYPKPKKGYRLLPGWVCGTDVLGNIWQHYTCVRVAEPQNDAGKRGKGAHEQKARRNKSGEPHPEAEHAGGVKQARGTRGG